MDERTGPPGRAWPGFGGTGVWLASLRSAPIAEVRAAARTIEALGYRALYAGEVVGGREAFAFQGILLAATSTLVTGTGIANLWARHPAAMAGGALTLEEAYPGRFVLGVGVSHAPIVERAGDRFDRPVSRMRAYLAAMDAAAVDLPASASPLPRLLAALGPRMLECARDRASGAHTYFVPPEHTARAREILGEHAVLVVEQAVVVDPDPERARSLARAHVARYLALENYAGNLRRLGYRDEDLVAGGSDRVVDALVATGDLEAVAGRIDAHRRAGADQVLLQPLGELGDALEQLGALASVLR